VSAEPGPGPAPIDVDALLGRARGGRLRRAVAVGRLALRMALHGKAKFIGTLFGVVFAVVLAAQQLGVMFGLLQKNTQFVDNAGADLWVVPPGTAAALPGQRMSTTLLDQARATPGIAQASALIMAGTSIAKPGGGNLAITVVGVDTDTMLGGPFNVVAGDPLALRQADTIFFEDAERERGGGVNLGSVREVGGYKVRVGGLTWGLTPFGPAYTFAELDLARTLAGIERDELSFVLATVSPGADPVRVKADLQRRVPTAVVMTRAEFHDLIVRDLLAQQLGLTFGISTGFALIVGFIVVMLSMFSSVIDNLREFGTLKALGLTNLDLARLLVVQSLLFASVGSLLGLGLVRLMAEGIRSAQLAVIIPRWLVLVTPAVMVTLCVLASVLAIARIRKLEPGMVFR
jgi:putative ABC transport system permease protein